MNLSFDEFAEFIHEWARPWRKKIITPETEFERDLGITGGDGVDLLAATEKRFNVRLSSVEHGYRKSFNLGPNEYLFNSDAFGPDIGKLLGRPSPIIRAFTVGELYEAVQKARSR